MASNGQAKVERTSDDASQDGSWLSPTLGALTAWIVERPQWVITAALGLALVSIAVVVNGLEFKTSRLDLLNPRSEFNQRWLAYLDEFGEGDDAIIVAHGKDPAQVQAAIDSAAAGLQRSGMPVENVLAVRDLSELRAKGLHYLSLNDLKKLDDGLVSLSGLSEKLGGLNELLGGLKRLNAQAGKMIAQGELPAQAKGGVARQYQKIMSGIAAESDSAPVGSTHEMESGIHQLHDGLKRFEPAHLTADEGRIAYVLFRLKSGKSEFARGADAIGRVRRMLAEVRTRHPQVTLGLTGMPVLEFDEMKSSQNDMSMSTWLSLAGVAILFWASFGGLRHTTLAIAVLILGMAWAFGYLTLTIGHLNILSVSFTAILVGLGIDFSIHYIAHYLQEQSRGESVRNSLIHTARHVGPGVITGGVTTALAFMTTSMTDFIGVAELGLIAGGGLLLCLLAALFVLPALLASVDQGRQANTQPKLIPVAPWAAPSMQTPYFVLLLTVLATAALAAGLPRLRFDDNLLNLQAKNLESVRLEREILATSDRSLWFAVCTANSAAEARALKSQFEALSLVDHVDEPGSLLPESSVEKRKRIARIASRLNKLTQVDFDTAAAMAPELSREASLAVQVVAELEGESNPSTQQWRGFASSLKQMLPTTSLNGVLGDLRGIARVEPPQEGDIPEPIASRCIGRTGKYLLRIYPRGDIWDRDQLQLFVEALEKVDPRVTGHPVQTYYASAQMRRAYAHASIYSLIAVTFVLLIDYGSILNVILAMLPLCFGVIQMLGAMAWLDIPLNPANMIALPLILGIGVDDGVHLVHDFRTQRGRYTLRNSTALAVMLTSATTMVGFGAMILAQHQGLRTLGQALTLGVFTCLVSSLWSLPALLRILSTDRGTTATQRPEIANDDTMVEPATDDTRLPEGRQRQSPRSEPQRTPLLQGLMSDQ